MTDDQPVETNKVIPTSSILASPNPEHVEGEGGPKTNTVLIAIVFVLALALVGFTAFYFGTKNRVITPPDIVSNVSPTPFSSPNESTNQPTGDLEQYDSPQLTNFGFAYDPEIWSISQLPTPTNTKLIMAAKDGGVLTFFLPFPWRFCWGGKKKMPSTPSDISWHCLRASVLLSGLAEKRRTA